MRVLRWIVDEGRSILLITLYFACCFWVVMVLKQLFLAQYGIEIRGTAAALLAALVTAKVVIVMEKVPLSRWLRRQVVVVEVVAGSTLYTFAVLMVLLVEKAVESRAEHGGVVPALANVFEHRDVHQVWATAICVGLSFLAFNAFRAIHRDIGGRRLIKIFLSRRKPASARPLEG